MRFLSLGRKLNKLEYWDIALRDAKVELGSNADFEEICDRAREMLSEDASHSHKLYLKSDRWELIRKKVLKRDNNNCVDCLKIIPDVIKEFKRVFHDDIKFKTRASDVHHLDYHYLNTELEEDYCISLCNLCHKLRHTQLSISKDFLLRKLKEEIREGIVIELLNHPCLLLEISKQNKEFIKSLTVNPMDWLDKEGLNGKKDNC